MRNGAGAVGSAEMQDAGTQPTPEPLQEGSPASSSSAPGSFVLLDFCFLSHIQQCFRVTLLCALRNTPGIAWMLGIEPGLAVVKGKILTIVLYYYSCPLLWTFAELAEDKFFIVLLCIRGCLEPQLVELGILLAQGSPLGCIVWSARDQTRARQMP